MKDLGRLIQDFWFANFAIGAAKNLSILIDTGSQYLILNPGSYEPTRNSIATGRTFNITHKATTSYGSGKETVGIINSFFHKHNFELIFKLVGLR